MIGIVSIDIPDRGLGRLHSVLLTSVSSAPAYTFWAAFEAGRQVPVAYDFDPDGSFEFDEALRQACLTQGENLWGAQPVSWTTAWVG